MLAVQRPPKENMANSQSQQDEFLMFGYSVESNTDSLREAPEPAPGEPLLSDTDNKSLSSFFENMNANEYNMPSFGEGLNFNEAWFDLPPQFMGSSTSSGPQGQNQNSSPTSMASPNSHMNLQRQATTSQMMPPPPPPPQQHNATQHNQMQYPPQHQHHPEDVLHAAATLLNNGAALRSAVAGNYATARSMMGAAVGQLQHQPIEEFKEDARRTNMPAYADDNFLDWMGTAASQPQRGFSRPVALPEYQWGSDQNFGGAQAYAPSGKDTVESQHRQQLTMLEGLEPIRSADNTRPSSPQAAKSNPQHKQGLKPPEDPEAPPRKRRKSKVVKTEANANEEKEDTAEAKAKPARRRKPKAEQSHTSSPPATSEAVGKRKKANGAAAAKAQRENLTEEQKRENHIKSEQKRRTLIKEGFDDLCDIIPELTTRGMSKSAMLTMAGEYLESLLQGNQRLRDQLESHES